MRVTDLTKQNSVLRNISANSGKMQSLQEGLSSGRRINRLSDDPIGATQAQDFKTQISYLDTLKQTMGQNFIWLDRTESEVARLGDLVKRTKVLTLGQANANADADTRKVTAGELGAITESMYQAGNAKIGKVHIFSGSKTFTRPLEKTPAHQPAVMKTEEGEQEVPFVQFEGNSSHPYQIKITRPGVIGKARFQVSDDNGETWSREKTLLPRIEVVNEDGKPSDKVFMRFLGPETDQLEVAPNFSKGVVFKYEPNPPVKYMGNEGLRQVATGEGAYLPLNVTAQELFFNPGKEPDKVAVFELMNSLRRAMEENDPATMESRLGDLDTAFNQILEIRARVGAVRKEMEDRLDNMDDREFSKIKQLSQLEDLDFPQAVVEMNMADARQKAALDTSARLIQPSLLNFLK